MRERWRTLDYMVWLSYDVLLAENFHNLIKLCQALSARFFSGVYFIPFMSPLFVSCSLWSLSYSPSSYRFSVSPPLFSPLSDSDRSLTSFASKDVCSPLSSSKMWPESDGGLETLCCCPASVIHRAVTLMKTTEIWRGGIRQCRRMHQLMQG